MFDLIGKTLGPYRILEQIGVGGMATVYKAYQPSVDRYVAVKVMPQHLSKDEQFVKRFQREARAIAKLEHPHILPIHDYGEFEGIAYIVMRYIEAGTLKDRMASGPLPLEEIDRFIGQIGSALDYAHRLGVIHRDIKPGNVLVDERGDAYLTDFGLARMMEATQQLTGSGVGVGTPAYMSPEQGQGIKADHRSDIYSLGVILYEMVVGRVPYEAETPLAVVLKHIADPLPLPREVNPNVPEAVERVILKALAKDPAHRFQTAGEMVQALSVAIRKTAGVVEAEHRAIKVTPPREDVSLVTRVQRVWETPRGKISLVGGALAAIVLLGWLLSLIPGSIAIVGPGATATSVIAQAATPTSKAARASPTALAPTRTLASTRTLAPTRTPAPTSTPNPLELGERITVCGSDICNNGNSLGLKETYYSFFDVSWSPDGSQFVFTACLLEDYVANPLYECEGNVYIAQRDGSNVTTVVTGRDYNRLATWSPDGKWIAYEWNNQINLVRPDGTGNRVLVGNRGVCISGIAWSLDSQHVAWIEDRCTPGEGHLPDTLLVINADGSNAQIIWQSADPIFAYGQVAWSPDSQSVVVMHQNGVVSLVNAECYSLSNGCDESSRTKLVSFPEDWRPNFHPQWISARGVPETTPTPTFSPQAEQARAFAEPILQAIANRQPDFSEDFSKPTSGWTWQGTNDKGQHFSGTPVPSAAFKDGALVLTSREANFWNLTCIGLIDHVAQADLTLVDLTGGSAEIQALWRIYPNADHYTFRLRLVSETWEIYKFHRPAEPTLLGTGTATMNGVGVPNRITIIARGSRFAIYLNDAPLAYFEDSGLSLGNGGCDFSFGASNAFGEMTVALDNVKVWNLKNVPGLP